MPAKRRTTAVPMNQDGDVLERADVADRRADVLVHLLQLVAVAAVKAVPPVASAMSRRASGLTRTGVGHGPRRAAGSCRRRCRRRSWRPGPSASAAAAAASASGRPTVVSPSVMQHDAGRHLLALGARGRGLDGVEGGEDRLADGGALAELEPSIGGLQLVAVGGRRHPDRRRPVERHQPDVEPLGQQVDEVERGLLGGVEAGRAHVVGLHRQRRVDGQDDRGPLPRHLVRPGRPGEGARSRRQAEQRQQRRARGGASRALRGHPVEQVEVGEPHGVGLPAPLLHQVDDGEARATTEQRASSRRTVPEERRRRGWAMAREAVHRAAARRLGGAGARSRRRATKRTRSSSQSRSVRSRRWSAPARRMRGGDVVALLGGGGGVALPELGVRRSGRRAARRSPGRRATGRPTSGSSSSRGSTTSIARISWRAASRRERAAPSRRVGEEVGHDDDEAPPAGQRGERGRGRRRGRSALAGAGRGGDEPVQQGHEVVPAAAGRHGHGAVGPEQHRAEAVAGAGGEEPDGRGGRDGQVALLAQRGAEVEAGRQVDERARSRARGRRSSRGRGAPGAGR